MTCNIRSIRNGKPSKPEHVRLEELSPIVVITFITTEVLVMSVGYDSILYDIPPFNLLLFIIYMFAWTKWIPSYSTLDTYISMPSGRFSWQGVWPLLSTDLSHVHAPLSVVIDCGPLSDPINGTVEFTISTILGSQAFYRCMEGFLLNGNGVRMCQENGTWTGSDPTCERELQNVVTLPTNFLNT